MFKKEEKIEITINLIIRENGDVAAKNGENIADLKDVMISLQDTFFEFTKRNGKSRIGIYIS